MNFNLLFSKKTHDGEPVFSTDHKYICNRVKGTQSNIFYREIPKDYDKFSALVEELSEELRSFKNENGEVMGYRPDFLIIPEDNDELLELARMYIFKKRGWSLITLKGWNPPKPEFLIMSNEAALNFCFDGYIFTWKFVLKVVGEQIQKEGDLICQDT